MKLVSFLYEGFLKSGFIIDDRVFAFRSVNQRLPGDLMTLISEGERFMPAARRAQERVLKSAALQERGLPLNAVQLLSPLPRPSSLRDGYAFRQHVETARRNRHVPMIPQFDEYPVFYFGNHRSVCGPGSVVCMPDHFQQLDFELEAAIVIGRAGRNIRAAEADEYIFGLMIMNDFSARMLQREEMMLNLGPAKGKDFATALGPWLVTMDELRPFELPCAENHVGKCWDLHMSASLNGRQISAGNLSGMAWTFAEIIERASYGSDLCPGDVIGSGTVGTGCLLELNGTAKTEDPDFKAVWLQPSDEISLSIDGLGVLSNTFEKDESAFSLLAEKKRTQPKPAL